MHDLDRTTLEAEQPFGMEYDVQPGEYEYESESEYEFEGEVGSSLDEVDEMTLAAELLDIRSEAELDQFLGNVFKKVTSFARKVIPPGVGNALGGALKGIARQALPTLGRAVGSWAGGAQGGDIGARLASQAGRFFGLELEGLSPEDREFEVARQYVRLASTAAEQALQAPPGTPPQAAAQNALASAARVHAPGLLTGQGAAAGNGHGGTGRQRSGRWVRKGRTIVLIGV